MVSSAVQRSHVHKPHEVRTTPAFREVISSILYKTEKLLGLAPFSSKMKVQMYNQGRGTGLHQPPQNCSVMLAVHMSLSTLPCFCAPGQKHLNAYDRWEKSAGKGFLSFPFPSVSTSFSPCSSSLQNYTYISSVIHCHLIFVECAASFICRRFEDFQLRVLCNPSALC